MLYEINVRGLATWSFGGKIYKAFDAQNRKICYVVPAEVAEAAARVEPGVIHGPHGIDIVERPDATEADIGAATHEHHDAPRLEGRQASALARRVTRSRAAQKEEVNV